MALVAPASASCEGCRKMKKLFLRDDTEGFDFAISPCQRGGWPIIGCLRTHETPQWWQPTHAAALEPLQPIKDRYREKDGEIGKAEKQRPSGSRCHEPLVAMIYRAVVASAEESDHDECRASRPSSIRTPELCRCIQCPFGIVANARDATHQRMPPA